MSPAPSPDPSEPTGPIVLPFSEITVTPRAADEVADLVCGPQPDPDADPVVIANLNLHGVRMYFENARFRDYTRNADYVLIDGWPIWLGAKIRDRSLRSRHRVGSTDWLDEILRRDPLIRVVAVGGSARAAQAAQATVRKHSERVQWHGFDGYAESSLRAALDLLDRVGRDRPMLVLVARGMPLQEQWIDAHRESLRGCYVANVGAVVDYLAGEQRLAPRWLGPLGMEWTYRLAHDPVRLWRRYLVEPFAVAAMVLRAAPGRLRQRGERRPPIMMDTRKADDVRTGVGHYAAELRDYLARRSGVTEVRPGRLARRLRPLWHLSAVRQFRRSGAAVYLSPESLVVPVLIGRRSAVTVHDLTPLTHPGRHTARNRLFHLVFLGLCLRRTGAVLVPTEAVRAELVAAFPHVADKTVATGEGSRFSAPADASRGRTILYVGTIEPRKNALTLIESFRDAGLAAQGWTLRMAGRVGWLDDADRARFERLRDLEGIEYLGYVSESELAEEYVGAEVFVYPSSAEGFGLPVLEAMACGVPVVISDDPALVEVAQGAALIVELGVNLGANLTDALTRITGDDDLRTRLRRRGTEAARTYSWEEMGRRTVEHLGIGDT